MKKEINQYIKKWEKVYSNGIPDEAPIRLNELNKVPSYKKIAMSILTLYIAKNIFKTLETTLNIQISWILFNSFYTCYEYIVW